MTDAATNTVVTTRTTHRRIRNPKGPTPPKPKPRQPVPRPLQTTQTVRTVVRSPPSMRNIKQVAQQRLRLSRAGKAWLRLYLNPMGKDDPGVIGYPDGSATRSVVADYRDDFTFTVPKRSDVYLSAAAGTIVAQAKYDSFLSGNNVTVLFYQLPFLRTAMFVRVYNSTPTAFVNTGVGIVNAAQTFPKFNAFQSNGAVTTEENDIGFIQSKIEIPKIADHSSASYGFRMIARGNTFLYTVPKLEEEGFVISAQFEPSFTTDFGTVLVPTKITDGKPDGVVSVLNEKRYAMRAANIAPSALTECFHNTYESKCVDGAYVPIYSTARDSKYELAFDRNINFVESTERVVGDAELYDTPLLSWNAAATWFTGVSKNCSILIKHRSVLQYVPAPGSDIANFTRQEPDEDPLALDIAWRLRNKLGPAYPSCYNDWGWLGKMIDGWLSNAPLVGGLYTAIKPSIKPTWDWLGDQTRDFFGFSP